MSHPFVGVAVEGEVFEFVEHERGKRVLDWREVLDPVQVHRDPC